MFIEPAGRQSQPKGWIEVITGSMFSGKTEELIRRMRRAQIARQVVEIFKPAADTRYHERDIVSHNATHIPSTPVESSSQILLLSNGIEVAGIDEAQFLDDALADVCINLANQGIRVIVAGLDMDYQGKPFGPIPALMAVAEYVTKVHAICVRCGDIAHHSHRISNGSNLVELGETGSYEPLCRRCFTGQMQEV